MYSCESRDREAALLGALRVLFERRARLLAHKQRAGGESNRQPWVRLLQRFLRNLQYGRERPKDDESCGQAQASGYNVVQARDFCVFSLQNVQSNCLENRALARARKRDPYEKNHQEKIRILSNTTHKGIEPGHHYVEFVCMTLC